MFGLRSYLIALVLAVSALPAAAVELVMVEQTGCEWCERWNDEIGQTYPKTTEGKFAPLRRVDLYAMPEDLHIDRRVNFTPTFLIVENGRELTRLEGYPGEDFFWPLLDIMLRKFTNYDPESAGDG